MSRSLCWMLPLMMVVLAVSLTDQYHVPAESSQPLPQEPTNPVDPPPSDGYYLNPAPQVPPQQQQPVAYQPTANYPQTLQTVQTPQIPFVPGRVTTGFPMMMQQLPVFQTPEPFSPTAFQGHAAYFQKTQQEQLQHQQALMQFFHAQRLQSFQQAQAQQQTLQMQMMMRQQFLSQMHPFMQQQFLQLNPVVQQQILQKVVEQQQQQLFQQQAVQQNLNQQQ